MTTTSCPHSMRTNHIIPVTPEELKVFAAWILAGASFDAKVSDLEGEARKAAENSAEESAEERRSRPLLPSSPSCRKCLPPMQSCSDELQKMGLLAMPIAQNTNALYLNASYLGEKFGDGQAKKLAGVSPLKLFGSTLPGRKSPTPVSLRSPSADKLTRLHLGEHRH